MPVLRRYQEDAVSSVFNYFREGGVGNPLVAMPTGTGKSLVIASFTHRALVQYPGQRFIMLTHVKELITQNAEKMRDAWPQAPLGIYSAGLKQRDTMAPIIFGGVQSIAHKVDLFGWRDMILIDEAHLLSPNDDTRYQAVIAYFRQINPYVKIVGFTATPFRRGQGLLTTPVEVRDGEEIKIKAPIFTDICFDNTTPEGFAKLIAEGYLCPVIPKKPQTVLDTSKVGISNNDYNLSQLQAAVDKDDINHAALRELCQYGHDRKKWLIFASGIEHAEHLATILNQYGVSTAAVHSKLADGERDRIMRAYKRGDLRALTNNNIVTTGQDIPDIDLIGMLRPTISTGLWVQMVGRGTRPFPGKQNCLVLDFARNTQNLGTIDNPVIPNPKGKGTGEVPVKVCKACGGYNHIRAVKCEYCGEPFPIETKITKTASDAPLLSTLPQVELFPVHRVIYNRYVTKKGNTALRVNYICGMRQFSELVFFELDNYAGKRARDWWRERHWAEPPPTVSDALTVQAELRVPRQIRVWLNKDNGKYPEVLGAVF